MKEPFWPKVLGYKPIDLGLERVKEAFSVLGLKEDEFPPIIHIAGTNGKGSTLAFIQAGLEQAGYRVHKYTSPHLIEFNERIVLNGDPISDEFLSDILEECQERLEHLNLTYFEGTTIAALLAFSKVPADYILLETGMGGRLDATNIFKQPTLTIITPISMDHMNFLGNDIASIAYEKASIMKQNVTCITSPQEDDAMEVLENYATKIEANLIKIEVNEDHQLGLHGEHQQINASVAAASLKHFDIVDLSAFKNVKWQARLQLIQSTPQEIWLDGGHNIAAAKILTNQIEKWQEQGREVAVIIGMIKGKDYHAFIEKFSDLLDQIYLVDIPDQFESMKKEDLLIKDSNCNFILADSIEDAIGRNKSKTILITGSLYLAGAVLEMYG